MKKAWDFFFFFAWIWAAQEGSSEVKNVRNRETVKNWGLPHLTLTLCRSLTIESIVQCGCMELWLCKTSLPALPCGVHLGLSHYWNYSGLWTAGGSTCLQQPRLALQSRKNHEAGGQESRVRIFLWNKKEFQNHTDQERKQWIIQGKKKWNQGFLRV